MRVLVRSWMSDEQLVPMRVTYDKALRIVLHCQRGMTRGAVLAYFDEAEHGTAGRALDAMVADGDVSFDGTFYRLTGP